MLQVNTPEHDAQTEDPAPNPFSADVPYLTQSHLEHIKGSAISLEVARERGYKSILGKQTIAEKGFSKAQQRAPGILIPQYGPDVANVRYIYRPDNPRQNTKGKPVKYEVPTGDPIGIDTHPRCIEQLKDPTVPLFITEGTKKVDSLVSHQACAIGLNGVWGFKGRNQFGGTTFLADFDYIALKDRLVYIVYDSDITTKPQVRKAMERLADHLKRKQADAKIVQLPDLGDGKTGVDDFLAAGHTVEDVVALAVDDLEDIYREPIEVHNPIYSIQNGCHCMIKYKRDGGMEWVPLCNWAGRIDRIIIKDNGIIQEPYYQVEWCLRNGEEMKPAEVPVSQFDSMSWVTKESKGRAYVTAGTAVRDNLRCFLQMTTNNCEFYHIFTHTGWREIDGKRVYLTGSGAIDRDDVEVELPGRMAQYALPKDLDLMDPVEATKTSIRFMDLGNPEVSVPLWAAMHLAPLSEILDPDFIIWVTGRTGSLKSTIVALALCHFGKFTYKTLPCQWAFWTPMRMLELAFMAKDIPLVIDNFMPGSSKDEQKELDRKAHKIIHAIGDRQGRGRYSGGTGNNDTPPPRGLIISTAEQDPDVEGTQGRMFIIRPEPNELQIDTLSTLQSEDAQVYSYAMGQYIRWLSRNYQDMEQILPRMFKENRSLATANDMHKRIPSATASLYTALQIGLTYALEIGAIDEKEYGRRCSQGWDIFTSLANRQVSSMKEQRLSYRFAQALKTLLDQDRLIVIDRQYTHFSEVIKWKGDKSYELELKPNQSWAGWEDDEWLYLIPDITMDRVSEFCLRGHGAPMGKKRAVMDDLRRSGMTDCCKDSARKNGYKNTNFVRYGPDNALNASVIKFKKSAFEMIEE
ncbi:MAG: DUF3854 domain-containing protein [Dehalococcoidia bacterium]|nr:DUF3854 domain-containing protein [Dehalococcoidia bacterium]